MFAACARASNRCTAATAASMSPPRAAAAYPRTRLSIAHNYHGLPVAKVRKLLGENALDAFPRLDAETLRKVATSVGITTTELAVAPVLADHPDVEGTGTLAFRAHGAWS